MAATAYTLLFSTIVSRHGIRAPFSPLGIEECNTYDKYSPYDFPDYSDWGMTEETYCKQWLTPHGEKVAPRMGEYYASFFSSAEGFDYSCDRIAVYADNSTRDHQTAERLLVGMGCEGHEIITAGKNNLKTEVWPVVHDHYNELDCPLPTEEQISGLYGGDQEAVTDAYRAGIEKLTDIIGMTDNFTASICAQKNANYDADMPCTLSNLDYKWTGVYWEGNFKAPIAYAGYWAEYFMFQYLSNVTDYAFGSLTPEEVSELYEIHVQNMYYGSSIWNAKTYSSQQLGYILASLESIIDGSKADGVNQSVDNNILLLLGHDFNNFYLQRLLGIDYFAFGFPRNVATTAGSLRFDLYQDSDGFHYVSLTYTAATPDQQRHNIDLTNESPAIAKILIPGCGDLMCPFETFKSIAKQAIDLNCVEQPLRETLSSVGDSVLLENDSSDSEKDYLLAWAVTATVCVCWIACIAIFACRQAADKSSQEGPDVESPTGAMKVNGDCVE